jgi:hypothetical protein
MTPRTETADVVDTPIGEALAVEERLVLAPCSGRFCPVPSKPYTSEGEYVLKGQMVGSIVSPSGREVPVKSPFAGWMMGYMVPHGAPVRCSEPVLWLRRS